MPTTKTEWPNLNTLSWLRLPCCGNEHPTRVEDHDGEQILVGAPSAPHPAPVAPPEDDEGFFIGWVVPGGAMEAPVKLAGLRDTPIPMWALEAIGPAVATQRRRFVRVEIGLEVRLFLTEAGAPAIATTLDLSEGGIRCRLDRWALNPHEKAFPVELPVENKTFELRGQAAWWGNLDPTEHRLAGIRFLDTEPKVADDLRAFVFRTQIEQRRNAR